jgi:glycosyltransferase involved in cell wall biosynthesis
MQIALICNSAFGTDGITKFVLNNHSAFSRKDFRYHLIYSSIHSSEIIVKKYIEDFCKDGDKAIFIPKRDGIVQYAKDLCRYLKNEKIDVVHVHGSSSAILLEIIAAKCANVKKIIAHSHSTQSNHNYIHLLLRPFVRYLSDVKLACGKYAGEWMYGKGCQFVIIPNCIDTLKYRYDEKVRSEVRKDLGVLDDTLVIGHVGTFTEVKNHDFLLKIVKDMISLGKSRLKLLLIGQGPFLDRIQEETNSLGLNDYVLFLGNRNDVPRVMMAMDVFCLPSLYEGFPIVSVEAQASGIPCLLSKNISPDVCITDLVRLLPIDEGTDFWIHELDEIPIRQSIRDIYAEQVKDAGYDIRHSASLLEMMYR